MKLLNYVLFQAGWFACVIGASQGWPGAGLLAVAAIVAVHLLLARRPAREAALLALCAAIGGAFDSLLLATGWVDYPHGGWVPGFAPYWIVALWILFGTTLNLSMQWLRGRALLAAALGAAGAPLSYVAGAELGAMNLVQPLPALIALAAGWAVLMPLLAALAHRFDGFEAAALPPFVAAGWNTVPALSRAEPPRAGAATAPGEAA